MEGSGFANTCVLLLVFFRDRSASVRLTLEPSAVTSRPEAAVQPRWVTTASQRHMSHPSRAVV